MNISMKYKFTINNLDCANCAAKIEKKLNETSDITNAIVNFSKSSLTIWTNREGDIKKYLENIIKTIEPDVTLTDSSINHHDHSTTKLDIITLISGVLLSLIAMFILKEGVISKILIILSYILLLYKIVIKAFKQLKSLSIDENLLITVSCVGAYFTNNIHEGLMVIILYDIGKILESIAVNNSRKSIKELMNIKPDYANLKKGDTIIKVSPEEVKVNDLVIVKPGEKVALDGIIVSGESKLNTQSITGESKLLSVSPGDTILSGTINTSGFLTVKITNTFATSTVSKILSLIDDATDRKAKTETFVSASAKIYTPIVLILAILTVIFLPLLSDISVKDAIYRALVFLVISCPCAIAISVPLSYFSGIGASSKQGILIKGSDYLDAISSIKTIVFDKTGTISTGVFSDYTLTILDNTYSKEDIIKYYVSGESLSLHPIGKSIISIFKDTTPYKEIKDFKEISGKGITYNYKDLSIKIGSSTYCKSNTKDEAIYLNINNKNIAKLILKDGLRPDAKNTIKKLNELDINVLLYTGDNAEIAKNMAKKAGIKEDNVYYNLLPQDKYNLLNEEISKDPHVAFVGDGINDAPSLALATVGISMGSIGSDAAIESSDIVIMDDVLDKIPRSIAISKFTNKIIKENLTFAILIKILVLALSFFGIASMWQAVFADTGLTLLTIINTTRILKKKY